MPNFEYQACDAHGRRFDGRGDALDLVGLDRELERRGWTLLQARAAQRSVAREAERLRSDELAQLTAQLATIAGAGIPLVEGLDSLAERQERVDARSLLHAIADDLRAGCSLSQALERRPQTFPSEYRAAVRAGERSGALERVLLGLAGHLESHAALRARATQALIYPAALAAALFGLVLVLLCFLLPRIASLYAGGTARLPWQTRALLATSDFLRGHVLAWTLFAVLAVAAALALRRDARWQLRVHAALLSLPRLGCLLRSIAAARFASTAAVLHEAGCDALTLLAVAGEASGNVAFRSAIERAQRRVEHGALFSEALGAEPLVDRLLVQVISVGERSGALAPALARVARRYEDEVPRELRRFLSVLEPLLLIVSGAIVTWILLAALLPIFELYEHLA